VSRRRQCDRRESIDRLDGQGATRHRSSRRPRTFGAATATAAGLAYLGVTTAAPPAAGYAATDVACPWVGSTAPVEQRVSQVLGRMTLDEKVSMVHGIADPYQGQLVGPVYAGVVPAIPRLCIPRLGLADGPAGVGNGLVGVTQLPGPNVLASTWDPWLAEAYGRVVGAEVGGKGANVSLGPTLDIARDPRAGRSFETFGEDPYLTAQLATRNIIGIQSRGVIAQAKHLAAYNQETLRDTPLSNSVVDERTLQEIYLPAYETAVRQGRVGSVMCGYNFINGVQACNDTYTISRVLKGQFGLDGFVTSDWEAQHASIAAANAGLDMQMPDGCLFDTRLRDGLSSGAVKMSRLDDMVTRILRPMFRRGLFEHPHTGDPGDVVTTPQHGAVALRVAEQGITLLKNRSKLLPLGARTGSIAVIGSAAGKDVIASGGGAAHVVAKSIVTPYQGIAARAKQAGVRVRFSDGSDTSAAAATAKGAAVAVVFAAKPSAESSDAKDIDLAQHDNDLIAAVAAANPNTVVVLNTGGPVTMPWLTDVKGVFAAWYPGQAYGTAMAALLFGDVNPSGKLPITFPVDLAQTPTADPHRFPGLFGRVEYSERLQVGYRWYDARRLTPRFPFGHGLSYTRFAFSNLNVSRPNSAGQLTARVTISNTGKRRGADVVQLYVGHPARDGEPPRALKGFRKVWLTRGASTQLKFTVGARAFSHWDVGLDRWIKSAGDYTIWVGDSSRKLPLSARVHVARRAATSPPTPPAPAGAPTGGDTTLDEAANAAACPIDTLGPWGVGLVTLVGTGTGPQAENPPTNP